MFSFLLATIAVLNVHGQAGSPCTVDKVPNSPFSKTLASRKHSISNLQLNNVSASTINVSAGSSINVKFDYSISKDGGFCPSCGAQFYWGINGHYSTCERDYVGYCDCSGSVNKNFTAPSVPGIYYLSVGQSLNFSCSNSNNRPRTDQSSAFAAIVVGSPTDNISRSITASPSTADGFNPVTLNAPFTGSGCYNYTDIRWYKDGTYMGSSFDDLNTISVTDPASYFAMNLVPEFDTIYSDTITVAPNVSGAGYALEFDGNDQIRANHSSSLNLSSNGELTIEAWVKLDNFSSDSRTILMKGGYGWALAIEGASGANNGKIGYWDQGNWSSVPKSTGAISTGEWTHVAVTVKDLGTSLSIKYYINGQDAGTVTSSQNSINDNSSTLYIGTQGFCQCNYWDGEMDEIRVWNDTLSQTTIQDWMSRKVSSSHPNANSLQLYYRFDENSGTTATDLSGNSNNGSFVGFSPTSWNVSSASIGDNAITKNNGDTASIEGFFVNDFSASPTGIHLYKVSKLLGTSTPPSGIDSIKTSAGVFGVNKLSSGTVSYTAAVNYSSIPGLDGSGNEGKIRLLRRSDPNANWEVASGALSIDTVNNIVYSYGNTGTQYVLGFANTTYPTRPGSGYALHFDGVNDYISIPSSTANQNLTSYTVSSWVYLDVGGNYDPILYKQSGLSSDIEIYGGNGSITVVHNRNNGSTIGLHQPGTSNPLPVGQWFHLAVTYTSGTITVYVNGTIHSTTTETCNQSNDFAVIFENYAVTEPFEIRSDGWPINQQKKSFL